MYRFRIGSKVSSHMDKRAQSIQSHSRLARVYEGLVRVSMNRMFVLTSYIYPIKISAMDTRFESHGITFIWDNTKAAANLRKHGIPFEQATEAFFDPFLKMVGASRREQARDAIIGMDTRWNLLFVVH